MAIRKIFILLGLFSIMVVGVTLLIVAVLLIAIWIIFELKRFRHKIFAIFLIALILFTYLSFTAILKKQNVNLTSFSGFKEAGSLYVSWLGSIFGNLKSITTNAIHMDWNNLNKTST